MGSSLGQNRPHYKDSISLDPSVRFGKLENGFTYYIRKNEDPENTVELSLLVKAGRINEDEDQLEYAHLLEHLLAGKTKHFPSIKKHFSQFGGNSNAHTGSRHTMYWLKVHSQEKEGVKDGVKLLRDWAQGIHYDEDYIAIQRGAIEGEMRVSDFYRNWIGKNIEREVFKNTTYRIYDDRKHLRNLQNFNYQSFMKYYRDWYRPDLQAAIIVGDINVDSIEYEIKQRFSDLKSLNPPKQTGERLNAPSLHLDGSNRFAIVTDSIRQELNLNIVRLRPNFESQPKTREDYKKMLLQQLYTRVLNAKASRLKEQYDPSFSVFDTGYGVNQFPDEQLAANYMRVELETNNLDLLKEQFQRSLIAWKQMHISIQEADIEQAKLVLLKNYTDHKLISSNSLIQSYYKHFIYGKTSPNPEVEAALISEILLEIELEDLLEFIFKYGNLDQNTVFIFFKHPKVTMPDYGDFKQWIKEIHTLNIKPLKDVPAIPSLVNLVEIASLPPLDDVEITNNEIGISTIELSNGAKVVFKPTTPLMDAFTNTVSIQAFRPNKIPLQNRQKYLAAIVAPQVMQYTGAGPYNKFDLERFKRKKGLTLNFRTTKDNQMIYGHSKIDDLPELLNLLHLYLNKPRKDKKGFDAWRKEKEKQLEGKGIRGSSEFIMEKIEGSWYPQVPMLKIEDLQKFTPEQIFQASKKWFSNIEDFTFVVTGDFNKDSLIPVVVHILSAFPAVKNQPLPSKAPLDFPLKKMEENLEFKNIDQVYARLFFPVKAPRDIKTQVELRLLSKALHQRINKRLRNGTYAPRASEEWLDSKNGVFAFRIDFDSALGNENRMLYYALEEFQNLRETGVDNDWLKAAVKEEINGYESRFSIFGYFNFWPDYLQLKLEENEDPVPGVLNFGTLMEHFISLEDINTAAKKYMSEEHLQQFLGYPEGYHQKK